MTTHHLEKPNKLAAEWRVYLASAMLQQKSMAAAEIELRSAIAIDPGNASWHALLGYALFSQNRSREAFASYGVAVQLDPTNHEYKELLQRSSATAKEASARDAILAKALEGSKWGVTKTDAGTFRGSSFAIA